MGRRAHRKDENHPVIVKHLQAMGGLVIDLAQYGMSCDLLVLYRKQFTLLEIKNPEYMPKSKNGFDLLTKKEQEFAIPLMAMDAPYFIVTSPEEAQKAITRDGFSWD